MNEFEKIGKRMPYSESKDYIADLINKGTEKAIAESKPNLRSRFIRRTIIGTAAAAVMAGLVLTTVNFETSQEKLMNQLNSTPSLEEVLNSLSDDQMAELSTYSIDDIPEY